MIELGWPLPKRKQFFRDLEKNKNSTRWQDQIDFLGRQMVLPVWQLPAALPKYRLLNGRTSSLQEEWQAKNPSRAADFFSRDPESLEVQRAQHGLLSQLINEKGLLPYFKKPTARQKGVIILDSNGFVINGNRRLCTWRELLSKDSKTYAHFAHVDAIVLPPADNKAIDRLEGDLQIEPDILAGYAWHALANMMRIRMQLHGLTITEVAHFYGKKESEVKQLLDMREYAATYLASRGKPGMWSQLGGGGDYAFRKMIERRKKITGAGEKRLFESAAFALIDDPKGGRLYDMIPDLHKYRDQVKSALKSELNIQPPKAHSGGLLGGSVDQLESIAIADAIDKPRNRAHAIDVIKEVIETQRSLDKEKGTSGYVLRLLQKASSDIQSAISGVRAETSWVGVSDVIAVIDDSLNTLRRLAKKSSPSMKKMKGPLPSSKKKKNIKS